MKKLMIITICLAIIFTNTKAQTSNAVNPNQSFGIRVSKLTAFENHEHVGDLFVNAILLGIGATVTTKAKPQLGVQYSIDLSKKRTLSVIGAFQRLENYSNQNLYSTSDQISLMAKMDLVWYEWKYTNWYSGIGAGVGFRSTTGGYEAPSAYTSRERLILHANVLGVKSKGKTSFFGELGLGALGIFSGGVKHSF